MQTAEASRLIDTTREGLHFLTPLLVDRIPEHLPNVLRADTCWTAPDGSILEYIGSLAKTEGPSLMFRRWDCPQGARPGAVLTLSEDTPARGAGTDLLLNYHDVWPGPTAVRVFLERDDSPPGVPRASQDAWCVKSPNCLQPQSPEHLSQPHRRSRLPNG